MGRTILPILTLFLLAPSASPRAEEPLYDPSRGGTQGWTTPTGRLAPGSEGLRLEIADPVSSFLSPGGLAIDAGRADRVEIDARVEPPGSRLFLYWTDDAEKGFVPGWRAPVPSGRSVIRMDGDSHWKGTVDRFLLAPEPGASSALLGFFEARGPRGIGERAWGGWRLFWRTELRSHYSVNGILGARAGPFPFPLLTGAIVLLLAVLLGWPGDRSGRADRIRSRLRAGLFLGAILLALRSGLDMARVWRVDDAFYAGKSPSAKLEAVNPPGFWRLLREARDRIPPGERVEVRAEKPYPYEKAGFYLYPVRVAERARYVVSYRTAAPPDSASHEEVFRVEGTGSLYRRTGR